MSLKLYIDHLSQPCRAIVILCDMSKIQYEVVDTRIAKGENRSAEFAKVNPNLEVPAISDGNFTLTESHAIMRYICRTQKVPEFLYPQSDPKQCALVDAYLDFHHVYTRRCADLVFNQAFAPSMGLKVTINLEDAKKRVVGILKFIEGNFLKNRKFLISDDKPTIADISAYCEIIQFPFQKLSQWLKLMGDIPEVAKEHVVVHKVAKLLAERAKL